VSEKLFAVALFALKVPPGCAVESSAVGVTFGARLPRVEVSTFLQAAYCCSASAQDAEAHWLAWLREHLPARDGWACHAARAEAMPDIDEMIERHDRGESLGPQAPGDVDENMPELPM
jgi:hypothetical protein